MNVAPTLLAFSGAHLVCQRLLAGLIVNPHNQIGQHRARVLCDQADDIALRMMLVN